MIQDSIRWFFNFLCSFYLFYKLLNLKNPKILHKVSFIVIFLIESFIFSFLEVKNFIFIFTHLWYYKSYTQIRLLSTCFF